MILENILKEKRKEIDKLKSTASFRKYEADALAVFGESKSLKKNLKPRSNGEAVSFRICSIIAEVKKASPSKGLLVKDYVPDEIAKIYEKAGASAVSVLTDKKFFMGSVDDLLNVKKAVNIPVLRKDFIIDEIQILESKIIGADAILLIIKALTEDQYRNLLYMAKDLSIEVLTEVSNMDELETAFKFDAEIIGINSRDLNTFKTDIFKTISIAENVPAGKLVIAESGIAGRGDIELLMKRGVNSFLIGEALVTANDPFQKIKDLLSPYSLESYYM